MTTLISGIQEIISKQLTSLTLRSAVSFRKIPLPLS